MIAGFSGELWYHSKMGEDREFPQDIIRFVLFFDNRDLLEKFSPIKLWIWDRGNEVLTLNRVDRIPMEPIPQTFCREDPLNVLKVKGRILKA